ncbi:MULTISPECIES: tautomerase family protein [unclassified Pseudomonas]|uniref:tautomerase family protein n=1 Tax=unclassified Pseudomonas TaxID=196821 RepID=UPI000C2FE09E|nr:MULTISPECIES: tautomerase family protein [unclassified Pseudomonas]MCU1739337.1 tautomerase family protein [Pseudomonas sp. 20S_6.2_Bac1]
MPLALIEVCRARTDDEIEQLLQSVYEAQLMAFNVPASDRQLRYVEHDPKSFFTPPDSSENFTLITIQVYPGRTEVAKQVLYQEIIKRLGALGIQDTDIFIGLNEVPRENWCIRNGRSAP